MKKKSDGGPGSYSDSHSRKNAIYGAKTRASFVLINLISTQIMWKILVTLNFS